MSSMFEYFSSFACRPFLKGSDCASCGVHIPGFAQGEHQGFRDTVRASSGLHSTTFLNMGGPVLLSAGPMGSTRSIEGAARAFMPCRTQIIPTKQKSVSGERLI